VRWREVRAGLIAVAIFLALVEGCPIPPPHETLPWQQGYVAIVRPVQRTILTPVRWIPRTLRVTQRFALFQAAEAERFRLEIWADDRIVFRAGSVDGPYGAELVQRRVRGVWNPTSGPTSQWPAFAAWIADRILADEPAVTRVTLRFERVRIADGVAHDTGTFVFPIVRTRGQR
jgi:hypothetical protein